MADNGKHRSYLFEKLVIDWLLATKNQTKTAQMMQCSFNLVNSIMFNAAERVLQSRDLKEVYNN